MTEAPRPDAAAPALQRVRQPTLQPVWQRVLRALLAIPLALLVLFEEWGWEPLHAALARLGRLPLLRQLEAAIGRAPPWAALLLFLAPSLLLLPVKLAALALLAHGHALAGLGVIVAAKLVGTAVLARLFTLTQPALMRLGWFARAHGRWMAWKAVWLARVRASLPWRLGRVLRRGARRLWQRWRDRWAAAPR